MSNLTSPPRWLVLLILVVGVAAISTAAILIRLAIAAAQIQGVGFSLVLAASRLTVAALMLLPAWQKVRWQTVSQQAIAYAVAAGVFLAVHFATWIVSISYTSIAASTAIVTTNPIWIALLCWLCFQEKPSRLTVLGIAVTLGGGLLIAWGDGSTEGSFTNPLLGDFLALIGSWAVSSYFLLGREAQRRGLGIGSYVAIAYSSAAIILLPLPLIWRVGYTGYPASVYVYLLAMALGPQLVGHTSFNWAMGWVSPILVSLCILFEPIGASLLAYWLFQEVPGLPVLIGAVVLLVGVAIAAVGSQSRVA